MTKEQLITALQNDLSVMMDWQGKLVTNTWKVILIRGGNIVLTWSTPLKR